MVTRRVAITAAHCLAQLSDDALPVRVFTGSSASEAVDTVEVSSWAIHPKYCPPDKCSEDDFDIAYVKLAESIDVGTIDPITRQSEYDEIIALGARVTLVGYGQTDEGLLGVKHKVTTSITEFTDSGLEFYAGGDGKDSCNGDSGGPALVEYDGEWRLAGVLSRGYECGEGGVYGVPFPALCWLRDDANVDLLPSACDECLCVDVSTPVDPPQEPEEGCRKRKSSRAAAAMFPGLILFAHRRRRQRQ